MQKVNFRSDNEAPAAPEIVEALARANSGPAHSYGEDSWSERLTRAFSELFERDVIVYPVATGTAANALAMAQLCPPYGAVYCHAHSHLNTDECGAAEFFTAGAKLVTVPGDGARMDPDALEHILAHAGTLGVHECRPSALSLTQATENGVVYSVEQVTRLTGMAKARGLGTHMDGARFANALAWLDVSPAEITWRAGIDMLSFGATKNGAMMAEALIVFDPALVEGLDRRRKRAAHLVSKQRFLSAQLLAYLEDGLWLRLAARANAAAARLAEGVAGARDVTLRWPVQANEVFLAMSDETRDRLRSAGFEFHQWPGTTDVYRLVMSYCVEEADIDRFVAAVKTAP